MVLAPLRLFPVGREKPRVFVILTGYIECITVDLAPATKLTEQVYAFRAHGCEPCSSKECWLHSNTGALSMTSQSCRCRR